MKLTFATLRSEVCQILRSIKLLMLSGPQMKEYEFRLRFNFNKGVFISDENSESEIVALPCGATIRLKGCPKSTLIKNAHDVAIIGGAFSTLEIAEATGRNIRDSILVWATKHRLGVDFGTDYQSSGFTDYGLTLLQEQIGSRIRNDIHGLDVYEINETTRFARLNGAFALLKSKKEFFSAVKIGAEREIGLGHSFDDRIRVAMELVSGIHFDRTTKSKLVMLVTAIEAVITTLPREPDAQALVSRLISEVRGSTLNMSEKASLEGTLNHLKCESITSAGKRIATTELGAARYHGKSPEDFFKTIYSIRSRIVHEGSAGISENELIEITNETNKFVTDLLFSLMELDANSKRP